MQSIKTIENNKVVMSRELFAIDYSKFTYQELCVLFKIISTINPESEELKELSFTVKSFRENLGMKRYYSYPDIYKIVVALRDKSFSLARIIECNSEKIEVERIRTSFFTNIKDRAALHSNGERGMTDIKFGVDEELKKHLLVFKDVKRDENGDFVRDSDGNIEGLVKYNSFPINYLDKLDSAYSLKLFLHLVSKMNSSGGTTVKTTFSELGNVIGLTTQAPTRYSIEKSIKSTAKKVNPYKKKYYNFKDRTLLKIIDSINEFTYLNVEFNDTVLDEDVQIEFKCSFGKSPKKSEEVELTESEENDFSFDKAEEVDSVSVKNTNKVDDCEKYDVEEDDIEEDDIEEVLSSFRYLTKHKITQENKDIARELLAEFSVEQIVSVIEEFKDKTSSLNYTKTILYSRQSKKTHSRTSEVRIIGLKNGTADGSTIKERLDEQIKKGGTVDFDKIFYR